MLRCVLTIFIAVLLSSNAYSDQSSCDDSIPMPTATYKTFLDSYKAEYSKLKEESNNWQKIADLLFNLTLFVTILGATVSVLQSMPDTSWKKWLVAIIGILIAITTYFKDTLPDGSFKTFQQAKSKSKVIEGEIDQGFMLANTEGITTDDLKVYIRHICVKVKALQDLNSTHSSDIPHLFDYFIKTAKASPDFPDWVLAPQQQGWIVSKGEGLSISEAKKNAERDGTIKISNAIRILLDKSFSKPIYKSLGENIQNSFVKMIEEKDVFFDTNKPSITYWILYRFDEKMISGLLNGITFPLSIFSTDLIANKNETLKNKLAEFGFIVSISPAPRGRSSETNAIFVGEGVPINAIKEAVRILLEQDIPLKAIVYPWNFQNSKLPEIQKINHLQIGGSLIFEQLPKLKQNDFDKLKEITSQNEMIEFSRESTEKLKAAFGLKHY
ncbi:hypothetical protein MGMO_93c00090 [Methyloglobulus morosus KoM1]|uniref:Uncharacterized protein n=1 Tax=Methyloglobulus morosus KoM1 TaxID=1116472 RepID=V5DWD6_9GAMM|nr:hypothetical protein [Methyloglobulus morosus]ESS71651.1 hypothetical protein MGMO_93c00090 [Methyloglobulus morosus KoM1]